METYVDPDVDSYIHSSANDNFATTFLVEGSRIGRPAKANKFNWISTG